MPKLVGYALMSTDKNAIDSGYLVKAMCVFCGKKFGSIEAARKCESEHINNLIRNDLMNAIQKESIHL